MNKKIATKWFSKIDKAYPLPEYPRPQMVRSDWLSLNGIWEYSIKTNKEAGFGTRAELEEFTADGEILVPFAVESALSGVEKPLWPSEVLIYRRTFTIPDNWQTKRILLNFEAVDYECECYINGNSAGRHRGGYLPFSFDITKMLNEEDNEIFLRVRDPSDSGLQQRGKQVLNPGRIHYTATSGIWQTVWLEAVPGKNHITSLNIIPDVKKSCVNFRVATAEDAEISVIIKYQGRAVAEAAGRNGHEITAVVVAPELWSPDAPNLYDLYFTLGDDEGSIDEVQSYFAFRNIEIKSGSSDRKWIYLNGRAVFLHAPLDQGYWPESGMTPLTDEAMIFDIQNTKDLGFNCTRKHIKIEPRRWYYHADRLGLMVMQDGVSGGRNGVSQFGINLIIGLDIRHGKDTGTKALKSSGRLNVGNRSDYESELKLMIKHLSNHPSIIMWIPFNEAWGQFDSSRIAEDVKSLDPWRLIDPVSGWLDQGGGDFRSRHTYVVKLKKPPEKDKRIYFISEYGGYNLLIDGHLWDEDNKFGYKNDKNRKALQSSYTDLIRNQLIPLISKGLGAAVYTQLADVEIESNGFFTYDRRVLKIDQKVVRDLSNEIYAEFERVTGGE